MKFYKDWLEVAKDEMKHFKLLNQALEELNFEYGSFEAHENLEDALKATKNSLKYRMGVVHRGLEAKGLDANPFVLKKNSKIQIIALSLFWKKFYKSF